MARDRLGEQDRVFYIGPTNEGPITFRRTEERLPRDIGEQLFAYEGMVEPGSSGKVVRKMRGCVQVNWGDGNVQWCPRAYLGSYGEFRQWEASERVAAHG